MATNVQVAPQSGTRNPIELWHLLSLDAPSVAALWTVFLARVHRVSVPSSTLLAVAVAVWLIYACDRLLDVAQLNSPLPDELLGAQPCRTKLEARHGFHHRHRRGFMTAATVAAILLAALLPGIGESTLALYCAEGAFLSAWFIVLHTSTSPDSLPKELMVGPFFAVAVVIPIVARERVLHLEILVSGLLFAALASLNCMFIHAWEDPTAGQPAHATTRWAVRHLKAIALCLVAGGTAAALFGDVWSGTACALSAAVLLALHARRHRHSKLTLRAAADLALLTPLAILPFLR